ncbi:hypothetical protein RHSIM_Rhsim06G0220200 [Rhododendron simsii]|uniref:SURP motif domain-containing protein n=1 Tax=Rhododendron simsii TaxID=118357 RepID=A0A834GV83_RHOSS|nr:hypothetical protein RHSIM_Rhsim06G0220200 [Rhododendron simsii]
MDLEVVGRHALLFDDDATASFVNSTDALVDWNSLLIDRYDVRHLLSSPPPPRRRRNPQQTQHSPPPSASSIESELDHERFIDLPPPSDEQGVEDRLLKCHSSDMVTSCVSHRTVYCVYAKVLESDQKNSDDGQGNSGFHPPFPVPESLLQSLPPTEKVHQIIARTAVFVSKHGGQSEIVLRVKQGDNPTFGFLMPDHYLHAYFRFLVDHQDLVQSSTDGKTETEKKGNAESNQTDGVVAGALSLLGSVYGSGEDEDGADKDGEVAPESKEILSGKTFDASDGAVSVGFAKTDITRSIDGKNEAFGKHSSVSKEKFHIPKRNSFTCAPKSGTTNSTKKAYLILNLFNVNEFLCILILSSNSYFGGTLCCPGFSLKLRKKSLECHGRNSEDREAKTGKKVCSHKAFLFLRSKRKYRSNRRNKEEEDKEERDYRKKIMKTKEFTSTQGKSTGHIAHQTMKKIMKRKGIESIQGRRSTNLIVLQDTIETGISTRRISHSEEELEEGEISSKMSDKSRGSVAAGVSREASVDVSSSYRDGRASSQPSEATEVSDELRAKIRAMLMANFCPISHVSFIRVQFFKFCTLDNARALAKMLKGGTHLLSGHGQQTYRCFMLKSHSYCHLIPIATLVLGYSHMVPNTFIYCTIFYGSWTRSRKIEKNFKSTLHQSRSQLRKSKKATVPSFFLKSNCSSDKMIRKIRSLHWCGSVPYRYWCRMTGQYFLTKVTRYHICTCILCTKKKHVHSRKKKHKSHSSSRHHRDRHKHKEGHRSSSKNKHESSSDEEHLHRDSSNKHRKISHSEEELEEGEISSKMSDKSRGSVAAGVSREASLDVSSSYRDGRASSQPSEATEVSDELRAKIRAMLMANL